MTLNAWFPSHPLLNSLVLNSDQKLFSVRQTFFFFSRFFFFQRVFPLQLAVLIIRLLLKLLWASSVCPPQPYCHIKSLQRFLLINNVKFIYLFHCQTGLFSEIRFCLTSKNYWKTRFTLFIKTHWSLKTTKHRQCQLKNLVNHFIVFQKLML